MLSKKTKKHTVAMVRLLEYRRSVWLFPAVMAFILIILTAFRISGTSVGIYYSFFYGPQKDHSLLYGAPQPIRSDEWLVNTQLTIAQARDNFPRNNTNIADGRDMSLDIDVPYKEWSVIFKPQNLVFLIAPLEYAFAFKWWLLLYLLVVGCYFFVLRLFPHKRLLASLVALGFSFSPFVFWWYQSFTLAVLFYGFFLLILGMRILNGEPVRLPGCRTFSQRTSSVLYILALVYLLLCFALLFYPPFQIPVALVVGSFLLGYMLQLRFTEKRYQTNVQLLKPLGVFMVAVTLTAGVGAVFVETRTQAISSITHTAYPGLRVVSAGGFPVDRILATYLQPQLQRNERGPHYYTNQSESASFILLLPYLLVLGLAFTAYEYRKYRRVDWVFVLVQGCIVLFLADLFVPGMQGIYRLLMLDKVPHERLILGLGFAGIIHMLYVMRKFALVSFPAKKLILLGGAYTLACLAVMLAVGRYTREHFPLFVTSWPLIIAGASAFCAIIYAIFFRRFMLVCGLLFAFSFVSVCRIHPLYQGLGPLVHNHIVDTMRAVSTPRDSWVSLDQIYTENFALLADRNSLSGIQFYPDISFWRQIEGKQADSIYNRYAHVIFTTNPSSPPLQLMQPDLFIAHFDCSSFIRQHVDFALSEGPVNSSCVTLRETVQFPARTFYIYRVH